MWREDEYELLGPTRSSHESDDHDEDFYYITDTSIAELAETLSRTSPPLLTLAPGQIHDGKGLHGSVTLTDTGRAVLAARQDRIATCGINRWLGGVHLQSGADVWRWDDEHERIRRCEERV